MFLFSFFDDFSKMLTVSRLKLMKIEISFRACVTAYLIHVYKVDKVRVAEYL